MGLGDYLRDYQPNLNVDDSGFEPIKYKGEVVINVLRKEEGRFGERINLELEVPDGEHKGRRLWKAYPTDKEDAVKRFADDMFTAQIALDVSTEEAEAASFGEAIGKVIHVRAYPFSPKKDFQGNEIPEEDRKAKQAVRIVKAPKDGRKADVPF